MTYARLVLRNLLRHPLRSILTTLSIALSIFLVCAVLTLPSALDAILEQAASNVRISVHHKAGLTYWLPQSYLQRVKTIPGVVAVNQYSWFGGVYDEPKNMFPNFAIDPRRSDQVWADYHIDPGRARPLQDGPQRRAGRRGDDEEVRLARRPERHPARHGLPRRPDVRDRRRHPDQASGGDTIFWFNRKYLEEAMESQRRHQERRHDLAARRAPRAWSTASSRRSTRMFRNSEAEVAAETEKAFIASFMSSFAGLMRVIMIVGFLVVGAVVLIAANTSAMGIRERIPEIAILKSIGFRRRPILGALLAESTLQGSSAALVGARRAYGVLEWLRAGGQDRAAAASSARSAASACRPRSPLKGLGIARGRRHSSPAWCRRGTARAPTSSRRCASSSDVDGRSR